jgi:DNA-binding NtrC family response regulator
MKFCIKVGITEKITILVVNDTADIREPLCEHLELNDFATLAAENAESAYHLTANVSIDLVVLDITMPRERVTWAYAEHYPKLAKFR